MVPQVWVHSNNGSNALVLCGLLVLVNTTYRQCYRHRASASQFDTSPTLVTWIPGSRSIPNWAPLRTVLGVQAQAGC
jgi:hypothetical protein